MVEIKGGIYGDMDSYERALKARNQGPVTKLDKDVPILVRFLAEPSGWLGYEEHYTEEYAYFPCTEEGCPGCDEGARASQKSLAPALDVNSGKVIVLQIPKTMGESLAKRYKRTKTIMDRDYECLREGEGRMDTKYDAMPSPPSKRNLSKYEVPDLVKALFGSCSQDFRDYMGIEDEEVEEETPTRKKRGAAATKKRRPAPVDEDLYDEDEDEEDFEDDEEDEEDEEPTPPRRRTSRATSSRATAARRRRR